MPLTFYFDDFSNEVMFVHPTETLLKDRTYTNFCKLNPNTSSYTLNKAAHRFIETRGIDRSKELNEFLIKYSGFFGINELRMSSQAFTTQYHYRKYFRDMSQQDIVAWLAILFEYLESVIEQSRPDYIFDFDNAEVARSVLWLIADKHDIPYITIEHSRYDGYIIPSLSMGRKTDSYHCKGLQETFVSSQSLMKVEHFRGKAKIANPDFAHNKTLKMSNNTLLKDIVRLFRSVLTVAMKHYAGCRSLLNYKNFPFIANPYFGYKFHIELFFRERYLLSRANTYFKDIKPHEKYVYFPLHVIPESSTSIKAPFIQNEEELIFAISKVLPIGYTLYLKEHGGMVGERPLKFYKRLSRLPNVKFIRLDVHNDPKDWIVNSCGVITISGTSAFEAVMLGKKALIFGSVPYENIKGITQSTFASLGQDILHLLDEGFDNIESCAKYVTYVTNVGQKVDFTRIHNKAYKILLECNESTAFRNEFKPIADFFRKAISIANDKIQ